MGWPERIRIILRLELSAIAVDFMLWFQSEKQEHLKISVRIRAHWETPIHGEPNTKRCVRECKFGRTFTFASLYEYRSSISCSMNDFWGNSRVFTKWPLESSLKRRFLTKTVFYDIAKWILWQFVDVMGWLLISNGNFNLPLQMEDLIVAVLGRWRILRSVKCISLSAIFLYSRVTFRPTFRAKIRGSDCVPFRVSSQIFALEKLW